MKKYLYFHLTSIFLKADISCDLIIYLHTHKMYQICIYYYF